MQEIKLNLSSYLNCHQNHLDNEGITIIEPQENTKDLVAISTPKGVIIKCSSQYYPDMSSIYENYNKQDFFELSNLSFLESLVRENDRMLAGPYLVLHANSNSLKLFNNDQYRVEVRCKDNKDLHGYEGFDNALSYNDNEADELSIIIWNKHQPISIATASHLHEGFYNIGINVIPQYRRMGIGAMALSYLTQELLSKNKIPHYSVSIANTASINLAIKVGYKVSYSTVFTQ